MVGLCEGSDLSSSSIFKNIVVVVEGPDEVSVGDDFVVLAK